MKGKTVLVTGGASGIGLAITKRFAKAGAQVVFWDNNAHTGNSVQNELQLLGYDTIFDTCDVSKQLEVRSAISRIDSPVDILVNNAGVSHVGNLESTTEEDFDRLYQVNIKGVYNCAQAVIPSMKTRGGVILNMASIVSEVGIPDRFAYSMTKGAVLTMTLSIACDYVDHHIRCNCISPARIHTPFVDNFIGKNYPGQEKEMFDKLSKTQPIGRMGTPDEVASLAFYLCSDEASFITGSNFPVDGGFIKLKP
ncbi:SDR family NAD(P)-dependent oxidoreductase [Anditalea andensis]|uniref:Short-chain dehydrogenase n=1 Tax=Anditalea andensis TaxID=1048983 RepID=A0A074LDB2_9BACT|nr:SDR family oxidoreductase [Anditalea andensis]KEO71777.1 short-chain dehydrogenase [Anditalea andensis]